MKLTTFTKITTTLIAGGMLSGCISEDPSLEGVALSGGNAIAHNTALQVVDPWPSKVHDTDLVTPAQRGGTPAAANAGAATPVQPTPVAPPAAPVT